MMELFIETLTGTAFELRVSPFETIMSVKAKIQRLEGIPISQQHLIWQSVELEDDYCLHDYSIHDGATLKLVLAMRGGPINTRRIPMEDPALREMAEYVEANRDEIWEKLPGNRQVTLLVFREGDQLNFFRVVDRGDGTLTPLSESLSGASIYNFNDEDEEDTPTKEKIEENVRMKEKMKQLRLNMEKLTVTKKPEREFKPTPPSRSKSTRVTSRHFSGTGLLREKTSLNKIPRLPPLGQRFTSQFSKEERASSSETEELNFKSSDEEASSPEHTLSGLTDAVDTAKPCLTVAELTEPQPGPSMLGHARHTEIPSLREVEVNSRDSVISPRKLSGLKKLTDTTSVPISSASKRRELTVDSFNETFRPPTTSKTRERKKELSFENLKDVFSRPTTSSRKDTTLGSLKETLGRSSSKYGLLDRRKEFTLESLSSSEARAMSGLLRQASLERIGSSRIGNFVTSASKSRLGNYHVGASGRIPTPDGRIVSGRLRMSASRDGRLLSPSHRLPPVKTKKKVVKRCYVCTKKTGLATSYLCRCGNNFCASHRYAESHDCTYDYKTEGRKLLEQSNPVVSAPKLPKI